MRAAPRFVILLIAAAVLAIPAHADDADAEIWHKYREGVMDVLKGHISAMSVVLFEGLEDTGHLQSHADGLAEAATEVGKIFPAGSGDDTGALPAIWEQPDKFAAAVTEFEDSSRSLSEAIASGDRRSMAAAFKRTGDSCKGCHESFRAEEY
ncbi:MAG: cytochrome c [Gammaproteobacteria bacterium]|nr:cytochrome c [Gammaproteobacteria bacterium]